MYKKVLSVFIGSVMLLSLTTAATAASKDPDSGRIIKGMGTKIVKKIGIKTVQGMGRAVSQGIGKK